MRSTYALILTVAVLTAGAWSGQCCAQAKMPRLGMLISSEANKSLKWHSAFVQGLVERGWVPGKNLVLEYRFARGGPLRFSDAAEELVRLKVDVIYAGSA